MATKKKTTVGKILSGIGSAIKKTASTVKNIIKSGSQGASAAKSMTFPVGVGLSEAQKVSANKALGISAPKPAYNAFNPNTALSVTQVPGGYTSSLNPTTKVSYPSSSKSSSSKSTTTSSPYFDSSNFASSMNTLSSTFGGTSAPTNVASINPSLGTSAPTMPNLPYETPDISQQKADLEASKQYTDLEYKDQKAQEQSLQDQKINENQSILDKILGNQPQTEDVRQDYEKYYKISAQQAKVESLTKDYNSLVAQRDQQIAQESSRFGLQDFTNNRINQIYDNSAARINEMSANIKFETALLTQKQELVQQAVQDFFKDEDRKLNLYELYMENNNNIISRLDKKEQDALDKAFELKKMQLDESRDMRMMVAQAAFDNPTAGIDPWNDTPKQAIEKASKVAGSNKNIFTQSQINSGASNAGIPISEFSNLPTDVKNFFINTSKIGKYNLSDILTVINSVSTGGETRENVLGLINKLPIQQSIKDYLLTTVPQETITEKKSFWEKLFERK